jgi:probable phosphoglycerate mutase
MPDRATSGTASRFHLLRHGQSLANVQRLIASSLGAAGSAYGLTATGREQVHLSVSAARATGLLPERTHVVSSPLLRARESAGIVADVLGTSVRVDARLIERSFGELELTADENYEQVWSADRTDPTHERWGVESAATILGRLAALLGDLDAIDGTGSFVLCTHGDVASVLLCAANGLALSHHREVGAMGNGELRAIADRDIGRAIPALARSVL